MHLMGGGLEVVKRYQTEKALNYKVPNVKVKYLSCVTCGETDTPTLNP